MKWLFGSSHPSWLSLESELVDNRIIDHSESDATSFWGLTIVTLLASLSATQTFWNYKPVCTKSYPWGYWAQSHFKEIFPLQASFGIPPNAFTLLEWNISIPIFWRLFLKTNYFQEQQPYFFLHFLWNHCCFYIGVSWSCQWQVEVFLCIYLNFCSNKKNIINPRPEKKAEFLELPVVCSKSCPWGYSVKSAAKKECSFEHIITSQFRHVIAWIIPNFLLETEGRKSATDLKLMDDFSFMGCIGQFDKYICNKVIFDKIAKMYYIWTKW